MSEQQAEETHGDGGSVGAGSTVPFLSDASHEASAVAIAMSVLQSPAIAPDHGAPKPDAPKADASRPEAPMADPVKPDASPAPGRVLIMSPGDRAWHDHSGEVKVGSAPRVESEMRTAATAPKLEPRPRRSFVGTAAMLAFATLAGAIGGALATTGLTHVADAAATPTPTPAVAGNGALEASIARIDADIVALKAGLEHTTKTSVSQFNKTSDRLDKIEKAQAEPNAKLVKLTEAVDKLRTLQAAAPAPVVATAAAQASPKEVTGSVPQIVASATPSASASPVPPTPPKPEIGRLPTVEGWTLTDVAYGSALIRGRHGTFEVFAGDYIPGIGRIDAIRRQDGQWVVVTSKGLIVAR